jgi:hypothetical protein
MILLNLIGIGFIPFFMVIVVQMMRMANPSRAFAYSYLSAAASGGTLFALADLAWLNAAARPDRDPQLTMLLNDLAWFSFITPVGFIITQNLCLALGIDIHQEFIGRTGAGEALGYSYHIGLFIVILLFTPHIVFFGSLFGITWPGLPSSLITVISVLTMTLFLAVLFRRVTNSVLRMISNFDDYFSWFITALVMVTGLAATAHIGGPYQTLLAVHILSVDALLTRLSATLLAEGPLLVIDALKLPNAERDKLMHTVFVENKAGLAKMSVGHRQVAEKYKSDFEKLEAYYLGVNGAWGPSLKARLISSGFRSGIPQNYSPTSFLINTLLPANSNYRTMDYVATIMFE